MEIRKVELQDASYSFEENEIFTSLHLSLPEFRVVRVFGAMGMGKSVLLRLMCGLISPTEGHVAINDQAIDELSFEEFLPLRMGIGYGFDSGGLLNNRTIYENLALPLEYHKSVAPEDIRRRVESLLERFELANVQKKRPAAVSASQRKATAVVRALVQDPQMLILDDPTTNLDSVARRELFAWMGERMSARHLRFAVVSSNEEFEIQGQRLENLEVISRGVVWRSREAAA